MTISPERERQLLASVEYPPAALRAIQFLLTRVRELEKREVISIAALQEITEADVYARQIADAALEALKGTP